MIDPRLQGLFILWCVCLWNSAPTTICCYVCHTHVVFSHTAGDYFALGNASYANGLFSAAAFSPRGGIRSITKIGKNIIRIYSPMSPKGSNLWQGTDCARFV